jgi:ureidoglycolate dehydrogenase (NAD+)
MEEDPVVRLNGRIVEQLMRETLLARGVCAVSAHHVAASLVQTSLRGVDSHGIHLFPHYCRAVDSGRLTKNPQFAFAETAPATAILDADHAFGHHAGIVATDRAVALARSTGIGAVAVKNSSHFGAASYFGLHAAEQGCIGLAFTNADALIKAHGSREAFTGTNPICFTAPIEGEEPFCLDMATSLVAWGKILNRRASGESIPDTWACDAEGRPVVDPNEARSLQPAGGYKGFGLSLVVDVLCAVLSGSAISKDLLPMYQKIEVRRKISHFFVALDVTRFCSLKDFGRRMKDLVERTRSLPPFDASVPVMVPGDPEKKTFAMRVESGIPIDEVKFAELVGASANFNTARM